MRRIIIFTSLVLCFTTAVLAQTDCEVLVHAALDTADSVCDSTNRNQACYGNITLSATPRDEAADFRFEQAGDIADIAAMQSLQLSSMSLTDETWGVALLKLQANLPDTLPGQNVTFLLFGDVNLTDASADIIELPVTATSGVNVRLRPRTDASVLLSLRSGQEVIATGQLLDGSWIRVRLDDGTSGWVSADFLDGDLEQLLPVESNADAFGPMQAFYFTTGYNDRPCDEAPDSGILIQTPKGAGTIKLRANDVQIELGSTVYLQAATGDALYVSVLEGHATLTAQGATQVVPAGTVSIVPLDDEGRASAPPQYPTPYAFQRLRNLPVYSTLLEQVTVARATATSDIPEAIAALTPSTTTTSDSTSQTSSGTIPSSSNLPRQGGWINTQTITQNTCDPDTLPVGKLTVGYPTLTFSEDGSTLLWDWGGGVTVTFFRAGENVYVSNYPNATDTINFTSPTTYSKVFLSAPEGGCIFRHDETGVFNG